MFTLFPNAVSSAAKQNTDKTYILTHKKKFFNFLLARVIIAYILICMTSSNKKLILVLVICFLILVSINVFLQRQNLNYLDQQNISNTNNLENVVSMFSMPPTTATRIYTYALLYRHESIYSRFGFLKKVVLPENFTYCSDRKILNLLRPEIFGNDETECRYTKEEEEIFTYLKEKYERSLVNEQNMQAKNIFDFSGKDETKWFQENYIAPPITPYAGFWETFFIDMEQLPELTPPEYGSKEDLEELGKVRSAMLEATSEQKEKVEFWAAGKGSATPLGIWLDIVEKKYRNKRSEYELLQIKKDISTVAHDSVIVCWNLKYKFMTKRPFMRDEKIVSQIMTPNFPSYPSGHATMSGAIATVLEELYPLEDMRGEFYSLAEEAANSRLWGGIHFDIDNQDGLKIGQYIGEEFVLAD
jgi:membrane-associated phospholipid phosphatase